MNPGPELDALVAEKVMGLSLKPYPLSSTYEIKGMTMSSDGELKAIDFGTKTLPTTPVFIPPYSTDIAAAWDVVERLTDNDPPHFQLSIGYEQWGACFDLDRPFKRVCAEGVTAPHAICLAALKAVGVTSV